MEKDLWQMIDETDAHNYGNSASQLKADLPYVTDFFIKNLLA